MFLKPEKLQNHRKRKRKGENERARRRKGGEENKSMAALLVFIMDTLDTLEKVHLAVTLSKVRLDIQL